MRTISKVLMTLALAGVMGTALIGPAMADMRGHDRDWHAHEVHARGWHHDHPNYEPGYVYAPPVVYAPPPEPSPGINFIIPLHIR
jgi:hypothetical protein